MDAPAGVAPAHADRPLAVEDETKHMRFRLHGQVGALHRRAQVAVRGAPAAAVALKDDRHPNPVLLGRVEVGVGGDSGSLRRLQEPLRERPRRALVGDVDRAARSMELRGAALEVLGANEVGQDVLEAPAVTAGVAPTVEVHRPAADVHHRVHRAGAAEPAASRDVQETVVEIGLGAGAVIPVELGLELLREGGRDLDV